MKRIINTGSIRFRFFLFIGLLLLVLLLLLNFYPYFSARDAVYQEKQSSMSSRGAALASALAMLDRPDEERVAEVLRLLDIQEYDRVLFVDSAGRVIYDSRGGAEDVRLVSALVESAGLPPRIALPDADAAYAAMKGDKKALAGDIRFVLLDAVGRTSVASVPEAAVRAVMARSGWG